MARRLTRGKGILFAGVGLVLLALTGMATWYMVNVYFGSDAESTEVRSQAASATGTVTLTMETASSDRYVKDAFPVDIYLDTAGTAVSAVGFQIRYNSGSAAVPNVEVLDGDATGSNGIQIISYSDELNDCMQTQVNQVQRENVTGNKNVYIDFALTCVGFNGYQTPDTGKVRIARILFLANSPSEILLEHDVTKAVALAKTGPLAGTDILQTVPPLSLKVMADTVKPMVVFEEGVSEGSTSTSRTQAFKVKPTELPERPTDTVDYPDFIRHRFRLNAGTWSAWNAEPTYETVVTHGNMTVHTQAIDANNNLSDVVSRSFIANLSPVINTVTPTSAAGGEEIEITGDNFGATKGSVYFGTIRVTGLQIVEWTETKIRVKVPATGNGDIKVQSVTGVTGAPSLSEAKPFLVETRLGIVFNFREINQDRGPRTVTVTVKNTRTTIDTIILENQVATWSEADKGYRVITDSLPGNFVPTNGYSVSVKAPNSLQRTYSGLTLQKGQLNNIVRGANANWKLLSGDFNGDNKITLMDFGLMMTHITQLVNPVSDNADARKVDLNGDGLITFQDIGLLLSNFTNLEVMGE